MSRFSADPGPQAERRCSRCVMDTTVPGIEFDDRGECNFCGLHDGMDKEYPLGAEGDAALSRMIETVKRQGRGRRYDCVVGISGGRDSTYLLYLAKKVWQLNPLAVHFNDGFGNPVAGQNMKTACDALGVDLRTITSDWRESKDLKIAFLKASTNDLEEGTDLGIAAALYGVAAKEGVRNILNGQSFRTEGISPLSWNYLDGKYLKAVHRRFGQETLRKWQPNDPGFNLDFYELIYYAFVRRIKVRCPFYHLNYVRRDAEAIIKEQLGWVYPGAHYYDDLYQALMTRVFRIKFNQDRRKFNYSALIRAGQMTRAAAVEQLATVYVIEDESVISLCIKRLGLTTQQFEEYVALPPKTFRDYPNRYGIIRRFRYVIKILSHLQIIPGITYAKYFKCGG